MAVLLRNRFRYLNTATSVKLKFDEVVKLVRAGESTFLVKLSSGKLHVYGYIGKDGPVRVFNQMTVGQPSLSHNGILMYQPDAGSISFHYLNTAREIGRIDGVTDTIESARLNQDGTLAAVLLSNHELAIFAVKTQKEVFRFPTSHGVQLTENCFSDNNRFLSIKNYSRITILDLRKLDDGTFSLSTLDQIETHGFHPQSLVFRKINSVPHFQLVSTNGTLKLYRFNQIQRSWDPVEKAI